MSKNEVTSCPSEMVTKRVRTVQRSQIGNIAFFHINILQGANLQIN